MAEDIRTIDKESLPVEYSSFKRVEVRRYGGGHERLFGITEIAGKEKAIRLSLGELALSGAAGSSTEQVNAQRAETELSDEVKTYINAIIEKHFNQINTRLDEIVKFNKETQENLEFRINGLTNTVNTLSYKLQNKGIISEIERVQINKLISKKAPKNKPTDEAEVQTDQQAESEAKGSNNLEQRYEERGKTISRLQTRVDELTEKIEQMETKNGQENQALNIQTGTLVDEKLPDGKTNTELTTISGVWEDVTDGKEKVTVIDPKDKSPRIVLLENITIKGNSTVEAKTPPQTQPNRTPSTQVAQTETEPATPEQATATIINAPESPPAETQEVTTRAEIVGPHDKETKLRKGWLAERWRRLRGIPPEVDTLYTDASSGRRYYVTQEETREYVTDRDNRIVSALAIGAAALAFLVILHDHHEDEESEHSLNRIEHTLKSGEGSTLGGGSVVINGSRFNLATGQLAQLEIDLAKAEANRDRKIAAAQRKRELKTQALINSLKKQIKLLKKQVSTFQTKMTRQHIHDHGHEMLGIQGKEVGGPNGNSYYRPQNGYPAGQNTK
jgi:hypothetical protein